MKAQIEIKILKVLVMDGKEVVLNHSAESIKQIVCKVFSVTTHHLHSKYGVNEINDAKRVYYWLLLNVVDLKRAQIGKMIGIDHTLVSRQIRRMNELLQINDPSITSKFKQIIEQL